MEIGLDLGTALLVIDAGFLAFAAVFTYESIREKERRAPRVGLAGVFFHILLGILIVFVPASRIFIAALFGIVILFGLALLIPGRSRAAALDGVQGYVRGRVDRFDERDTVFSRDNLSPDKGPKAKEIYERYYGAHPEREQRDAARRAPGMGIYGQFGRIDGYYRPNLSLDDAFLKFPIYLAPHAKMEPEPDSKPEKIDPSKATRIVKEAALHIGADLVGICKVDSRWAYSNLGDVFDEWERWGEETPDQLPYAVVVATEMDAEMIGGSPHSPCDVEASFGYAKGAFVGTLLADWFAGMGYRAVVHDFAYNEILLVPHAVQAGLGELGRHGYLITDKFGSRVRLAAVTTDMPLVPDQPIDLGVEEFCTHCLKCAESCPGKAIPLGDKVVHNGTERWKLDQERCFEYWYRAGTGCGVCVAVCTFSRPDRSIHRLIRWLLPRSPLARKTFPYIDNFIYHRKWKTKSVPAWVDYPKSRARTDVQT